MGYGKRNWKFRDEQFDELVCPAFFHFLHQAMWIFQFKLVWSSTSPLTTNMPPLVMTKICPFTLKPEREIIADQGADTSTTKTLQRSLMLASSFTSMMASSHSRSSRLSTTRPYAFEHSITVKSLPRKASTFLARMLTFQPFRRKTRATSGSV